MQDKKKVNSEKLTDAFSVMLEVGIPGANHKQSSAKSFCKISSSFIPRGIVEFPNTFWDFGVNGKTGVDRNASGIN